MFLVKGLVITFHLNFLVVSGFCFVQIKSILLELLLLLRKFFVVVVVVLDGVVAAAVIIIIIIIVVIVVIVVVDAIAAVVLVAVVVAEVRTDRGGSACGGHWQHCFRTESVVGLVGFTSMFSRFGLITLPSGGSRICFCDTIR